MAKNNITAVIPECDLFRRPTQLYNIAGCHEEVVSPIHCTNTYPGVIQFQIPKSDTLFTSLKFALRYVLKIRNVGADGVAKDLAVADNVATIAYSHMTIFQSCDLLINGVVVEMSNGNWPFQAYIKQMLSTSLETKTQLMADLTNFDMDTAGQPSETDDGVNLGRKPRRARTVGSKLLPVCYDIPFDISASRKYLPPDCSVEIRLTHAPDSFRLHASVTDQRFYLYVDNVELVVRRFSLQPNLAQEIRSRLSRGTPITYNITRPCILGPTQIPLGANQHRMQVSISRRCSALLVFMTDTDVATNYKKTPFDFKHNNLRKMQVFFEGSGFPREALAEVDFQVTNPLTDKTKCQLWFRRLMALAGGPCGITFDHFCGGFSLMSLNLEHNLLSPNFRNMTEVGQLSLELNFRTNLAASCYVYVYGLFDETVTLEPNSKLVGLTYCPGAFG